ncbi:hypothetical protein RJ640_003666 [Escallonia rubra]|uniref:Uncharacterized protein n=1 Tax=Escallonia rubra TaxID=112253 RepID=A0AA88UCR0_9ASTE|nr:hypothetical protein RJ640_003666 [Escallonia rubra]
MYYKGVYHLFYQYNPNGAVFDSGNTIEWAHSVSYDLVNWIHLSHALYPTKQFDINSCWSGSATILPGNKPVIVYTGVDAKRQQVQNLAMPKNLSDPFLKEWEKYSHNPILSPTNGIKPDSFRDPSTAWLGQDGKWRIIVGGEKNGQGMALLYHSRDFLHWTLGRNPLYSEAKKGIWECPDFYPVYINSRNGVETFSSRSLKYVLKASIGTKDYYKLGTYASDVERFIPDKTFRETNFNLRYDYGKFYASKTFFDHSTSRRILCGWINESDSSADDIKKGWSGIHAVPRRVFLGKTGKQLVQWPVEEIERLREKHVGYHDKKLKGHSSIEIAGITTSQADVEVTFKLPKLEEAEAMNPDWVDPQLLCSKKNAAINSRVGPFGLLVLAAKDLSEQTAIFFRIFKGHNNYVVLMCSDQRRSSMRKGVDKTTYGAFVDIDPRHEMVSLRSLVDHSVIESFGGEGRACITARVYPVFPIDKEAHLHAFNNGSLDVVISRLDAWSDDRCTNKISEWILWTPSEICLCARLEGDQVLAPTVLATLWEPGHCFFPRADAAASNVLVVWAERTKTNWAQPRDRTPWRRPRQYQKCQARGESCFDAFAFDFGILRVGSGQKEGENRAEFVTRQLFPVDGGGGGGGELTQEQSSRPNWRGPMYYKGIYHLFYQANPHGAVWGNISWGHSISYDLVNWVHLDYAIYPSEPYDINGCWSGSVTILSGGNPAILYTGNNFENNQVQNLAVPRNLSDPFLREWVKSPYNPLMTPDGGIDPKQYRDPTTAWLGPDKVWRTIIGSQINGHGTALLYHSKTFLNWTRGENPLHFSNKTGMWECPDFYPVSMSVKNGLDTSVQGRGIKHVLKASFSDHDYYVIGKYDVQTDKYIVDFDFMDSGEQFRYDYGIFYASKTFYDSAKKRRILWGWVTEADSRSDDINKGWAGLQLVQWPVEEVEKLRTKQVNLQNKELKGGSVHEISGVTASQADVEISFELSNLKEAEFIQANLVDPQVLCSQRNASTKGTIGPFGLLVLASKDLTEQTAISFRIFKGLEKYNVLMCSDQSRSSSREGVDKATFGAFVDVDPSREKISLRSLIDHSIVESFGGEGRTCMTARVYPKLAIDKEAHLYAFNNGSQSVTITSLTAWSMKKAQIAPI